MNMALGLRKVIKGDFTAMNVGQLKQLLENVDDDKTIRVWVELENSDGVSYLSARRLVGITDEEDFCCLCALFEQTEESD